MNATAAMHPAIAAAIIILTSIALSWALFYILKNQRDEDAVKMAEIIDAEMARRETENAKILPTREGEGSTKIKDDE